jgi:hypothetical protein
MRNEVHKKGVTNEQIRETFAQCRKHGILTIAYNMLGGPTETKKDMLETFRFNVSIKPNKPIFFVYQELTHDLEAMGLTESSMGLTEGSIKQDFTLPGKQDKRNQKDRGTIQFGEPMQSRHYSKNWLILFQYFCYSYFIAKRVGIGVSGAINQFQPFWL